MKSKRIAINIVFMIIFTGLVAIGNGKDILSTIGFSGLIIQLVLNIIANYYYKKRR